MEENRREKAMIAIHSAVIRKLKVNKTIEKKHLFRVFITWNILLD